MVDEVGEVMEIDAISQEHMEGVFQIPWFVGTQMSERTWGKVVDWVIVDEGNTAIQITQW